MTNIFGFGIIYKLSEKDGTAAEAAISTLTTTYRLDEEINERREKEDLRNEEV